MESQLVQQQVGADLPDSIGVVRETGLVLPPPTTQWRLRHLAPEVFSTDPESHLVRFAESMLGDSGVGQVRKRILLYRLQSTLDGSHFYTLDRFYGALFSVRRRQSEQLTIDPSRDLATADEWQFITSADARYRARIIQFARGIAHGPTPLGIELLAEAILGVDVDVFEGYAFRDGLSQENPEVVTTFDEGEIAPEGNSDLPPAYQNYGNLEGLAYGDIEAAFLLWSPSGQVGRRAFQLMPKRPIQPEERRDLIRVLRRLAPATATYEIGATREDSPTPYLPVPARQVVGSSNYWEVVPSVMPSRGTAALYELEEGERGAVKRPPFSGRNGEAWSYVGRVSGIASYAFDPQRGEVIRPNNDARTVGGRRYEYTPDQALFDISDIAAGRAATMGVAHPQVGAPNVSRFVARDPHDRIEEGGWKDTTSPMYVDGLSFRQWRQVRTQASTFGYWSSLPRSPLSSVQESLEFTLQNESLTPINYITLEVPRFPHRTEVSVRTDEGWQPVMEHTVTDSFPQRIVPIASESHPQHDVEGHWQRLSVRLPDAVYGSRVQVTQVRLGTAEGAPVDEFGAPVDFSLGVRKLDVGFRVWQRADYPRDIEPGEPFATTVDAAGNRVDYALMETPASNLETLGGGPWVSEPQPTERAAVRLYADVRDGQHGPQVVDRIYIDPIFTGSKLNVYWSDGEVATRSERWEALDEPISVPVAQTLGSVNFSPSAGMEITSSLLSSVVFDNGRLGWEVDGDWSVSFDLRLANPGPGDPGIGGIQVLWGMSQAESAVYLGSNPFYNTIPSQYGNTVTPSLTLWSDSNTIYLFYTYNNKFIAKTLEATSNQINLLDNNTLSLYWNNKERYFTISLYNKRTNTLVEGDTKSNVGGVLRFRTGQEVASGNQSDTVFPYAGLVVTHQGDDDLDLGLEMFQPRTVFIGSADFETRRGATISHFGLFTGTRAKQATEDFRNDPRNTVVKDRFAKRGGDSSDNAVIRFAKEWVSPEPEGTRGFRGGPGHDYDQLVWHAVPRDFRAERGNLYMPSIRAKYFCLEFTDLTPTPFEQMSKQDNTVEVMPTYLYGTPSEGESDVHESLPGTKWAIGEQGFMPDPVYNPAAEGMYATDPERKIQLANQNLLMGVHKPYGSTALSSVRFDDTGPHNYSQMVVNQEQRIAYFAGLNQLEFSRSMLASADDTPVYQESYADLEFVDEVTMRHSPGMLTSINGPGTSVTSKVFLSNSRVQGVQFATHQSPSVQVIPNDGFTDPALLTAQSDGLVVEEVELTGEASVNLAMPDVFPESVRVTSQDEEVVYEEGTDYTLGEGSSPSVTQIARLTTGGIGSGDTVKVYYEHDLPGWQRVGMVTLTPQPERARVLMERDVSPELFWRSPDGNIVQRVVNPVFASRKGPGLSGKDSLGGLISPLVAVTRKGNIEAAVRVTMRSDLDGGPLKLEIIGPNGSVVASEELRKGYSGETYEWTVMANAQMFTGVLPDYGKQTLIDHPVYPIRPADTSEEDPEDYLRSRWPLVDTSGGNDAPFTGVRVRISQSGASSDSWYVEQLSLYDESIFWEFSPGSDEWFPAIGNVRNNAHGVVRFTRPSKQWRVRATALRSNLYITGWQVRPWYVSKSPVQFLPQFRGATASLYDQYPPIEDDPMYQQWTSVVPRSWYLNSQSIPEASIFGQPLIGGWSRRWRGEAGVAVPASTVAGVSSAARVRSEVVEGTEPVVEATIEVAEPEDD